MEAWQTSPGYTQPWCTALSAVQLKVTVVPPDHSSAEPCSLDAQSTPQVLEVVLMQSPHLALK